MASIVVAGDTSGTVTLTAPAVSGTTTLTLPITSGTVLTNGTNTNFPAGSVLQVVNVAYATSVSTTSTSLVDTGLSASITPTSASNKILVIVNQTISPTTGGSNTYAQMALLRNSTNIYGDYRVNGTTQYVHTTPSCSILDSPATTSSVTYKTQFATGAAIYTMEAQHAGLRTSTITLMEIKG
jgi:hypothetical protein